MNLELLQTLNPSIILVLPLHQGPAESSQGPAASANSEDEDSEYSDEKSARSQDTGRTVIYPDLYVLTNDEHWTVTPETHKYAAAAGSYCFVTTENGEQQDVCNLTTMPCVQRSLCLDEVTNDSGSTQVEVPKGVGRQTRDVLDNCMATCGKAAGARAKMRSRARKEASAQKVRGYYKQFAGATHLEYKSWFDDEVFDLIDMRKAEPKNYVTRRWQLPQGNGQMGTERFPGQAKGLPTDRFSCFHKTRISNELPERRQVKVGIFSILISKQPVFKDSLMM